MKIERINENQIRCTLTREDLEKRNIRITELAYGSEKARLLFRDMMEQAASDFGFEANDIPLVVEAIPVSMDKLVLVITKVEDPEELDTRFSRFAPGTPSPEVINDLKGQLVKRADEILDLFKSAIGTDASPEQASTGSNTAEGSADAPGKSEKRTDDNKKKSDKKAAGADPVGPLMRLYSFANLDDALSCIRVLSTFYKGESGLYKSLNDGKYCFLAKRGESPLEDFNRACNILSEYGKASGHMMLSTEFMDEHFECLVAEDAVAKLSV